MKLLMVSVGRGRYAVAADAVERIIDPAVEPEFQRELRSDRTAGEGARYATLNLHEVAGESASPSGVCLLLGNGEHQTLMRVDCAEAIHDVPAAAIAPLPVYIFATPRRLFRGIFSDGRVARLLLDEGAIP